MKNVTQMHIVLPQKFSGAIVLRVRRIDLQPIQPTQYLTRNELALHFNVHPSTISKWTKAGKIKAVPKSRCFYYRPELIQPIILIQL